MITPWGETHEIAAWLILGLTLAVYLSLSTALSASAFLSRIALRRLATEDDERFVFLDAFQDPLSTERLAANLIRQFCLLTAAVVFSWALLARQVEHPIAIAAVAVYVFCVVVLQAFLARILAGWSAPHALRWSAPLIRLSYWICYPIVVPFAALQRRVARRHENGDEKTEEQQDEDVEALIQVGEASGILEADEGEMVRGIVDLDETLVREIMTPRTKMQVLSSDATVATARGKLLDAGHSRLPVFEDSIDHIVGVLHARDLFRALQDADENVNVRPYLREATFVQETASAADLLRDMRLKTKMAIVVDSFGGVAGLVTLEDLLEEIVGEIRDEHEPIEAEEIQANADGSYKIAATTHVEELEDLFGIDCGEREFDTVGGWIVAHLGRVPAAGERLELDGLHVEILKSDRRRIDEISVTENQR